MWWLYFVMPSGEVLEVRRERSFGWGYGHIPLLGAVVGTGAGLHVAAYYLEGETKLDAPATVLAVVIPVAVFLVAVFTLYAFLTRTLDRFHFWLLAGTAVPLVVPLVMAANGAEMAWCLVVLSLSPWVSVVGYELHGHRHNASVIEGLRADAR